MIPSMQPEQQCDDPIRHAHGASTANSSPAQGGKPERAFPGHRNFEPDRAVNLLSMNWRHPFRWLDRYRFHRVMVTLKACIADITKLNDGIVNAGQFQPVGRRCGWSHPPGRRTELIEECRRSGRAATGDAKMTKGYQLPARYIIHTVGPIWDSGMSGEAELLASCHRRSLELAGGQALKSIAFPAISTGVFGYPVRPAAEIAVTTVRRFLRTQRH